VLDDVVRFVVVTRAQPLVIGHGRRERWRITERDLEELELRDVLAESREADGDRRRQEEPIGPRATSRGAP
jgi:hypothetical protein